jgi:Amidohydrolase
MVNGMLVVDAVVHAANPTRDNVAPAIEEMAEPLLEAVYGLHSMLSPESHRLPPEEFLRDWSAEELASVLFLESDVDLCDHHSLPLDDFFVDGLVRLEKGIELKRRAPHRVCLHAAINPLEGDRALEQVEHSIREVDAHGIKVYPARFVNGQTIPVRLDDPEHGIPVIEKAIDCGAKCIAVHKYFPVGPTRLNAYAVDDVEIAGMFPQINFEVLHPGFAFVDETAWLLSRYPNVYVNLEWTISAGRRARWSLGLRSDAPRRLARGHEWRPVVRSIRRSPPSTTPAASSTERTSTSSRWAWFTTSSRTAALCVFGSSSRTRCASTYSRCDRRSWPPSRHFLGSKRSRSRRWQASCGGPSG